MIVTLLETTDENNVINKSYKSVDIVNATIKEKLSEVDLVLELYLKPEKLQKCNYLFIPEFNNRYYFVEEKKILIGELCNITCHVDVLQTYASEIKALECVTEKAQSSNIGNKYINDNSYVVEDRHTIHIQNYPGGFNNTGDFILITVGG